MKLLHTSDWHLGHQLYGYDRTDEHLATLSSIGRICDEYLPDLMLVSGDIFHTPRPSAGIQKLLCDFLTGLHEKHPSMPIILTAGNHDSGRLHEVFKSAWSRLNIHVIGTPLRDEEIDGMIISTGKCVVAAVPYFAERFMPDDFYSTVVDRAVEIAGDFPVILMAHTSVAGCDFTGHENNEGSYIGGVGSISETALGRGFDYCALGHIHRPQTIGTEGKLRYSGTPLPVNFEETYPHSVSLVTVEKGMAPKVEEVLITPLRPLVTIPENGAGEPSDVLAAFRDFDGHSEAYIRLNVEVEGLIDPEISIVAREIAASKKCRFCLVNPIRKETGREDRDSSFRQMNMVELKNEDPVELAARYARDLNEPFGDDMRDILREVIAGLDAG